MDKVPVYILAGGQSRRFGANKARMRIDGRPMIVQLAARLNPIAHEFVAVAQSPGEYEDLGLRTIPDQRPGLGPLAGLEASLADMKKPGWLLLLACDWIGLRSEWIEALLREAGSNSESFDCVYFDNGKPQPLLALYHTRIAPLVEELLTEKSLAMMALIDRAKSRALPPPEDWNTAENINYRSQLDRD